MKQFLRYLLYGGVVGIANIIPGLSGGTMAVVLGIYDRLIESIATLRKRFVENMKFLVPIVAGAGIALFLAGKGIDYLLMNHAMPVNFFFIGVILSSLPMLYRRAAGGDVSPGALDCQSSSCKKDRTNHINYLHWVGFVVALLIMLLIGLLSGEKPTSDTAVRGIDLTLLLSMFVAGAVAAICMLIPGISGSFVLLLLGVYPVVIKAINDFNLLLLFVMGIGILAGLFFGAKIIHFLVARFPQITYFIIMGFVVGSVPVLILRIYQAGTLTLAVGVVGLSMVTFSAGVLVTILFPRLLGRTH